MIHRDFLLTTAAAGVPNGRGHAWQDRWSTGQLPHGGWLVVADGITGGTRGETAAATAVAVVCSDGVAPDHPQFPPATAPALIVRELLRRRSPNLDDATATAIHLLPLQRQPQTN